MNIAQTHDERIEQRRRQAEKLRFKAEALREVGILVGVFGGVLAESSGLWARAAHAVLGVPEGQDLSVVHLIAIAVSFALGGYLIYQLGLAELEKAQGFEAQADKLSRDR